MYKECEYCKNQKDCTKPIRHMFGFCRTYFEPTEQKKSFAELFDNFCAKYGEEWVKNPESSESCADTFIDYLKSQDSQKFDYEKVNNLK